MTPRDFIAHFDTIAEAPNGITRLREFVFRLAVRGRLVPQIPEVEEPVEHLLRQLKMGKKRLLAAGTIAKPRYPYGVRVAQVPFEIPATWTWLRLGDVGAIVGGGTPKSGERLFWADGDGVPWLTPADMRSQDSRYLSRGNRDITLEGLERSSAQLLPSGSVLFSSRAPIGHVGIAANPLSTNQGFKSCVPYVTDMSEYLYLFLKQAGPGINEQATGTTFKEVSGKEVALIPIPIPPLAEQHRIVAKADELMDLLDRLKETRRRRENMRTASRDSSLAALRAADTSDGIKTAWILIASRIDDLFMTPADVSPLREVVFQLAIQGQLAPQNDNDEPATTLLDRIDEEKKRLIRKKRIGKPKHLPPITDDKAPFSAPSGWMWCRLGSILKHCRNGISVSPNDSGIGYPMLRISAATSRQDAIVDLDDYRFADIPPEKAEPYLIEADDLLACRFNGNLHFVGRVSIVPNIIDRKIMHPDKLIKLKTIEVSPRYACYAMNAESTRKQIHEVAATTAGNIGINGKQLQNLLIPIPPLAEQYRIVSKVEELILLADQLEYHLAIKKTVHDALSTTAFHHLTR